MSSVPQIIPVPVVDPPAPILTSAAGAPVIATNVPLPNVAAAPMPVVTTNPLPGVAAPAAAAAPSDQASTGPIAPDVPSAAAPQPAATTAIPPIAPAAPLPATSGIGSANPGAEPALSTQQYLTLPESLFPEPTETGSVNSASQRGQGPNEVSGSMSFKNSLPLSGLLALGILALALTI